MHHFDRKLAPYCLPGVGCHKDKSGHNSDIRQEHPCQLQLAGERAKNKEGVAKVNFSSGPSSLFSVQETWGDQCFSNRCDRWHREEMWLYHLSTICSIRYSATVQYWVWIHSGMGLLTNAGPQPWHPGNHIFSNQQKPFLWNCMKLSVTFLWFWPPAASPELRELAKKAGELCEKNNVELGKISVWHSINK